MIFLVDSLWRSRFPVVRRAVARRNRRGGGAGFWPAVFCGCEGGSGGLRAPRGAAGLLPGWRRTGRRVAYGSRRVCVWHAYGILPDGVFGLGAFGSPPPSPSPRGGREARVGSGSGASRGGTPTYRAGGGSAEWLRCARGPSAEGPVDLRQVRLAGAARRRPRGCQPAPCVWEIGARLPGLARSRACRGQAGAARFGAGQIGRKGAVRFGRGVGWVFNPPFRRASLGAKVGRNPTLRLAQNGISSVSSPTLFGSRSRVFGSSATRSTISFESSSAVLRRRGRACSLPMNPVGVSPILREITLTRLATANPISCCVQLL